ncbi:helix-turn-helix domain-containing protein [Halomonas denitrificans]|uniref:GlxA family transcriptional regulator n=1 Tax=Halomonas denitrificans TaxID=370769 RepID=UPI001CD70828|nr:helix-turn-helix domain-containing protein [Halomonas denitrificans]MCA0975248.1 helix-turn-helix domain-containing protein [Halomonas denitrificans]
MPHAAILTLDQCYASTAAGFADILNVANSHLRLAQAPVSAYFQWDFVSAADGPVTASNGLPLQTHPLDTRQHYDLVFVPSVFYGGSREFDHFLAQQAGVSEWLLQQWKAGAWVAANCTGTFVLAQTGLLNERVATTTWWLERQFRERFPEVDLRLQSVVTEDDRLMCAGASASYLIQTIRVIERCAGPVIASQCAKTMLIDVSQVSQIPYLPLLARKQHSDALVSRAQQWLQRHMSKRVRMTDLAKALAVSDRTLIRRFRAVMNQTPLVYLQELRLETARALLDSSSHSVEEIVVQVGYSDVSSFTRLFRQRVGLSPGVYRERFHMKTEG